MFGCCAFLPVGLLMIIAPMISAGRGMRAFVSTALIELGVVLAVLVLCWPFISDNLGMSWEGGLAVLPIFALLVFPLTMGGIILYIKIEEGKAIGKVCRECGYDLRESPERCPECGTPVKFDPDRF